MPKKSARAAKQPMPGDKVYIGEAYPNPNDNIGRFQSYDQDSAMVTVSGTTTHAIDGTEIKWNYRYPLVEFMTPRWDELKQQWNMQDVAPM